MVTHRGRASVCGRLEHPSKSARLGACAAKCESTRAIIHGTFALQPLCVGIPWTLYRKRSYPVGVLRVPSNRLEDRIRELCAQAIASDETDFQGVISELRSAMREHIEKVRKMALQ